MVKRIENVPKLRSVPAQARTANEAVALLARVTRERQRLEQERKNLNRKMRSIDTRLATIATAEAQLLPKIQPRASAAVPARAMAAAAAATGTKPANSRGRSGLPGFTEMVVHY